MTAGMKNLMGVIWDRRVYHRDDLHQTIADFLTFKQPTLNVLDAYRPMFRNGPRGLSVEDLVEKRTLLASTDIVALDAAAAKLLGLQPADVRHVKIGDQMKLLAETDFAIKRGQAQPRIAIEQFVLKMAAL